MSDITSQSLTSLVKNIKEKKLSSEEITKAFVDRSEKSKELNSYITEDFSNAIDKAKKFDDKPNFDLKLPGIPMAVKDLFCTKDIRTTAGSKILENFIPTYESTVTQNIWNEGGILLGKLNCDEFAMGSSNETSFYGNVQNPIDKGLVPGGSSGGSAAAVAAGLAPLATGTDTGGSIRQPAALCGITGLKPSYGRVSRYGMIAFASSMDQAGPMARTAEDCALVLNAMAGHDPLDSTCADIGVPDYSAGLEQSIEGLRVGIPKEFFSSHLNDAVAATVSAAIKELEAAGAVIVDVSLPSTDLGVSTYYVIAPAEASANLSRYDGVRYGYRCDSPSDLQDLYLRSRTEGFGEEVKRRILIGTFTLSAASYDQYFMKAQQVRRLIAEEYQSVLKDVDVIAGPSAPSTAFVLNDGSKSITDMYMEDVFTIGANLAGLPAISVPVGLVDGLPVGMQLIGSRFGEAQLLNIAHQFQIRTDWHSLTPDLEGLTG